MVLSFTLLNQNLKSHSWCLWFHPFPRRINSKFCGFIFKTRISWIDSTPSLHTTEPKWWHLSLGPLWQPPNWCPYSLPTWASHFYLAATVICWTYRSDCVILQCKYFQWLLITFVIRSKLSWGFTSNMCPRLTPHFNTQLSGHHVGCPLSSGCLLSRSLFLPEHGCLAPSYHQISAQGSYPLGPSPSPI